jgi:hypothetical protein
VKIVSAEDLQRDVGRRAKCCFRFPRQPCSIYQKASSLSLGALAFFGIGLAIAQVGPGGEEGSISPVPLSEIQSQATIPAAQGVTLDFSDGGSNNVSVMTSDNPSVVQIISKTNAVTVAPGTAHLKVANFGQCPKPTGMVKVSCDPIPTYSVTINVQHQP